jgi:hypothetical protein
MQRGRNGRQQRGECAFNPGPEPFKMSPTTDEQTNKRDSSDEVKEEGLNLGTIDDNDELDLYSYPRTEARSILERQRVLHTAVCLLHKRSIQSCLSAPF